MRDLSVDADVVEFQWNNIVVVYNARLNITSTLSVPLQQLVQKQINIFDLSDKLTHYGTASKVCFIDRQAVFFDL